MPEYIEREAFIETVKDIPMWGSVAAKMVENIPVADVVEVVRCKDCVSFCKGKCDNLLGLPNPYPDSFCSFGERKENDYEAALKL